MKTRKLGSLKVSELGIGCMPMVGKGTVHYGAADEAESLATIHRAIDLGVTFFDTAEAYGPFSNEEFLGRAIKGRREGLVIATKFGFRFEPQRVVDSTPATIKRAVEGSLKRLGIETIDLYYQHRVDPNVPIEETVGAVADLVKEGKVRHIGLSEAGVNTVRRAAKVAPIAALQTEYSIWERGMEEAMLPLLRELGIGFVPYSPLGRGFLAGTVTRAGMEETDYRWKDPRYAEGNFEKNLAIVDVLKRVGAKHGASAAQVALAWLLAQGDDIVPIPGVKRRATMGDSMKAADLVLSKEELAVLDHAAPRGATAGLRYSQDNLNMVDL